MREKIKQIILELARKEGIKIFQIILFGSRARREEKAYSDWDILIVVEDEISLEREKELFKIFSNALSSHGLDCDIIIKNRKKVDYYKDKIGSVIKQALMEGIRLYG